MPKATPVRMKVWSRLVSKKGRKMTWGLWVSWDRNLDPAKNIKQAINAAIGYLKRRKVGTVIYIGDRRKLPGNATPVFHAKYGTDKSLFMKWKSNPVADYWRRKVG